MALALIIISALLFIVSYVVMQRGIVRVILYVVSFALLVFSLVAITAADSWNWGMKLETKTTTKLIKPVSSIKQMDMNMLVEQKLGTKDEKIVVYKLPHESKTKHTQTDIHTTNKYKHIAGTEAKLVTKTKQYVYKNQFYKLLFAGLGDGSVYKSRTNTFELPDNYVVLTAKQAKSLQKQAKTSKKQQAAQKQQMQAVIKQQMMAAMQKNPTMTPEQQKALQKQIVAKVTAAAMDKQKQKLLDMDQSR